MYRTRSLCTVGLSPARIYSALYLYVYVVCDLKVCVNFIELGSGARLTAKGKSNGEVPATLEGGGGYNWDGSIGISGAWGQDRWIFVSAHIHACCPSRFLCDQ